MQRKWKVQLTDWLEWLEADDYIFLDGWLIFRKGGKVNMTYAQHAVVCFWEEHNE